MENLTIAKSDVIARLRESRSDSLEADRINGWIAGRLWAAEMADWEELFNLSNRADDRLNWLAEGLDPKVNLLLAMRGIEPARASGDDLKAAREISESFTCVGLMSIKSSKFFLDGFVEGAAELYEEVRDLVEADETDD